jgi:predicted transcriptional regulator
MVSGSQGLTRFAPGKTWGELAALQSSERLNMMACYHDTMTKNMTVRLPDELAADTEALARVSGKSVNETIKDALADAVAARRRDPKFKARIREIIEEDRELLERLAK